MKFNEFIRFFLLPVYRPVEGLKQLISNKHKILYSILIFLFLGVIYTISVQLAYMRGIVAPVEPFINIPAESYYFWQRFYQIPFFFLTSIIFAGAARLMSIPFKGKGSFEDIFCILSISLTLPMFLTMWVPETIYFILSPGRPYSAVWFDILRQITGIIWPLVLCAIGISISEKIRWYKSIVVTVVAAIPMAALMAIFIR